jgi:hypothetical protein
MPSSEIARLGPMRTDVLAQALLSVPRRQALFLALMLDIRMILGAHVAKEVNEVANVTSHLYDVHHPALCRRSM